MIVSIIAYAGDSQSSSMEAIQYARQRNFAESERCLQEARDNCLEAHRLHTQFMSRSITEKFQINFVMVHASNHLSVAEVRLTMAELFLETVKEMSKS